MLSRVLTILSITALVATLSPGAFAHHGDPSLPNDPMFDGQWGPQQINAEQAWDVTTGSGAIVAVVDTGVDFHHEDLAGKILPGQTFIFGCGSGQEGCGDGDWESGENAGSDHGTHVAGIAAAHGNNGIGIAGVAFDSLILPVKVLSSAGSGSNADVNRGIRWAADHDADVINLSLGGLPAVSLQELLFDTATEQAIAYAHSRGAVVVASAGNDSFPVCGSPGFELGVLCVGATDNREAKAAYSNEPFNQGLSGVAAPGGSLLGGCDEDVVSTVPDGSGGTSCESDNPDAYDDFAGTSMASPHVAGVAGLVKSLGCTREQTVDLITATARNPISGQTGEFGPIYGNGIVDAAAAVTAAQAECTPSQNSLPIASDDAAGTSPGVAISIPVLDNDHDPDGDPLSISRISTPEGGTAVANPDGTITYTPGDGFIGVDTFVYAVSDGRGGFDPATVTVAVPGISLEPCAEPGVLIMEDPAGDSGFGVPGAPEHDALSLHIAEPDSLGPGKVVFTLQMASMEDPPPNTTWPVIFKDQNGADRWIRMATDALGIVTFASGLGSNPSPQAGGDNPGTPAPESSFDADGTIRIVVDRADIGDPQPADATTGDLLTAFQTRIRIETQTGGALTPDNMPGSLARVGSYTIIGSENCVEPEVGPDVQITEPADGALLSAGPTTVAGFVDRDLDPVGPSLFLVGDGTTGAAGVSNSSFDLSSAGNGGVTTTFVTAGSADMDDPDNSLTPTFTSDEPVVLTGEPVHLITHVEYEGGNTGVCPVGAQLFDSDGNVIGQGGRAEVIPPGGLGRHEIAFQFDPIAGEYSGLKVQMGSIFLDCGSIPARWSWGTDEVNGRLVLGPNDILIDAQDVGNGDFVEVFVDDESTPRATTVVNTSDSAPEIEWSTSIDLSGLSGLHSIRAVWREADGSLIDEDLVVVAVGVRLIEATIEGHDCAEHEWHFVISQIHLGRDFAPESIHVTWDNGAEEDVPLRKFAGRTAQYNTSNHLDASVVGATAVIYEDWSGNFNLGHGPCN